MKICILSVFVCGVLWTTSLIAQENDPSLPDVTPSSGVIPFPDSSQITDINKDESLRDPFVKGDEVVKNEDLAIAEAQISAAAGLLKLAGALMAKDKEPLGMLTMPDKKHTLLIRKNDVFYTPVKSTEKNEKQLLMGFKVKEIYLDYVIIQSITQSNLEFIIR